ncbi:protein of unknown function [Streptomyces sp. KY75]|nr:protein of unknown function [Streptomyces sp. KY75]
METGQSDPVDLLPVTARLIVKFW